MKRVLSILIIVFSLPLLGWAQQEEMAVRDTSMKITYVVTDALIPGYIDINLRLIMADSIPSIKFLEDSLKFYEMQNGVSVPLETQKVIPQRFDVVTIITDVSSSMWRLQGGLPVHMDSAKAITDSLMQSLEVPYAINLYTYDEQLYRKTTEGENSFKNVERPAKARYTHLFENVDDALNRMKDAKGRKILFVIGDGENDHNKKLPIKITQPDLLEKIRNLDSSYVIFPIALGPKIYEGNFQQLVSATKSLDDRVIYGTPGAQTFEYVSTLHNWPMTHMILAKSKNHPHIGAEREIVATLEHRRDTSMYRLGMVYAPWNQQANWEFNWFGGSLLILLIFIVFAFLIPYQQWRDFKKKYIKNYWEVKKEGIREYDPLTKFPFRDDDQVVVRCEHMTSLETWQYEGRRAGKDSGNRKRKNRCIYYPNKCESGVSPGGSGDFFAQVGIFKFLFWGFLGAIAGFLSWGAWALFFNGDNVWLTTKLNEIAQWPSLQERFGAPGVASEADGIRMVLERFLDPFTQQMIIGGLLAVTVTFLLSFANEAAQSRGGFRGWVLIATFFRSLLRALVATLAGVAIFAGVGMLQGFVLVGTPYIPGLLGMLLLGVVVARILTTRSGIRHRRGFTAGLVAGFVAFHIYYLPMLFMGVRGYESPKMIAFLIFGGVVGFIMSRGAPALENSEMEVWTARKRYGKTHITELLRKNEEVTIGRGPTATVRIKIRHTPAHNAPGNATQTFAQLTLRNEVVYLIPEIFTEVNGEPVAPNERVPLFDGDKISFQHKSPSFLRYREGRGGTHPRRRKRRQRDRKRARALARAERVAPSGAEVTEDNG